MIINCKKCGKEKKVQGTRQQYCGRGCARDGYRNFGESNPRWKGGRYVDIRGYMVLSVKGKRVLEHRKIMADSLGRELTGEEIVHHLNGDRLDNRLENLEVMSQAEHVYREGSFQKMTSREAFLKAKETRANGYKDGRLVPWNKGKRYRLASL